MQKSEIHILIVEDDATLGRALEESLKRAGYGVYLTTNYSQAMKASELNDFMGAVIDCMLPQKNGVDLASEINKRTPMTIVLTSGIFKDKAYAVDARQRTNAKAFFNKPFDIQQLVELFDQEFQSKIEKSHDPLSQLLFREKFSARDKLNAIKGTEDVNALDLPYVYSLLMDAGIAGKLEVVYGGDDRATVHFNQGRIQSVTMKDVESYFGTLLVEKGFITPEELNEGLNMKVDKPIGERLVSIASLSPHAVEVIQHEQMVIRLSKTIRNASVKIHFTEQNQPASEIFIDGMLFTQLLSDWICSKVESDWLKSKYTPWLDCAPVKGPNYSQLHMVKDLAAVRAFGNALVKNAWPHTLEETLQNSSAKEVELLRGLHFCLLQRYVHFDEKGTVTENFSVKMERLQRIWAKMEPQNHFQVLNVNQTAKQSEISRSYHELAKSLHPDKLPQTAPPEMRELAQKIFTKITSAYQVLNDPPKKAEYLKTLEMGHAQEILKAETEFEEGLRQLQANSYRDARKTFEKVIKMRGHRSDTIIYIMWAMIKEKRHRADRKSLAEKVESLLEQVAHEDRHSPQYFLVRGMYYEITGQIQKAYNTFKRVLTIDPTLLDAKREMSYIKANYSKQKSSLMTDDLSTVVARIFKKKTG